jgi:hypothetical protein
VVLTGLVPGGCVFDLPGYANDAGDAYPRIISIENTNYANGLWMLGLQSADPEAYNQTNAFDQAQFDSP